MLPLAKKRVFTTLPPINNYIQLQQKIKLENWPISLCTLGSTLRFKLMLQLSLIWIGKSNYCAYHYTSSLQHRAEKSHGKVAHISPAGRRHFCGMGIYMHMESRSRDDFNRTDKCNEHYGGITDAFHAKIECIAAGFAW